MMIKKLAELKVKSSADYKDTIIKALQDAGFTVVLELELIDEKHYIIAEGGKRDK